MLSVLPCAQVEGLSPTWGVMAEVVGLRPWLGVVALIGRRGVGLGEGIGLGGWGVSSGVNGRTRECYWFSSHLLHIKRTCLRRLRSSPWRTLSK